MTKSIPSSNRRRFASLFIAVTAGSMIIGRLSLRRSEAATPSLTKSAIIDPRSPNTGAPPWLFSSIPDKASRFVPKGLKLSDEQKQMLSKTPLEFAQEQVSATRDYRRQLCEKKVKHATPELCERVLQENGHAIERTTNALQRFLRGEIDQDTFQLDYHKAFVDRAMAVEGILSAEDYLSLEGIIPGADPFVMLMESFVNMPAGFRLGDDIIAQGKQSSDPSAPNENQSTSEMAGSKASP